jgi:hypothetical protein
MSEIAIVRKRFLESMFMFKKKFSKYALLNFF